MSLGTSLNSYSSFIHDTDHKCVCALREKDHTCWSKACACALVIALVVCTVCLWKSSPFVWAPGRRKAVNATIDQRHTKSLFSQVIQLHGLSYFKTSDGDIYWETLSWSLYLSQSCTSDPLELELWTDSLSLTYENVKESYVGRIRSKDLSKYMKATICKPRANGSLGNLPVFSSPLSIAHLLVSDGLLILESTTDRGRPDFQFLKDQSFSDFWNWDGILNILKNKFIPIFEFKPYDPIFFFKVNT